MKSGVIPTLIIIDAQNEYATGALKTVNVTETRKSIAKLLEPTISRKD
jgi:hypothetical protein